jgi:cysteine-S-conjugate beta-lyase
MSQPSMPYPFDLVIDRGATNSIKWRRYPQGVLPLWVADMDFAAPEPVLEALRRAVQHGVMGYEAPSRELCEIVAARMQMLYGWHVSPEAVIATPGVVAGFTAAAHALCPAGEGILIQPPVYPPFLKLGEAGRFVCQEAPLTLDTGGPSVRYALDFDLFEKALHSGGVKTGMFLLCNPHNPIGLAYSQDQLRRIADICIGNNVAICSDEIHSELILGDAKHIPIAALDPAIADRSITLIAPSKTFNIPGLFCGFAIIPNPILAGRFKKVVERMAMHVNGLGLTAAQAAFSGACDEWLAALRAYLTANRDLLVTFINKQLSGVRTTIPDATYLAWLDCTRMFMPGKSDLTPYEFFLKEARVALNEGKEFGSGGEGFVRLNFGCPKSMLIEALGRMKSALGV